MNNLPLVRETSEDQGIPPLVLGDLREALTDYIRAMEFKRTFDQFRTSQQREEFRSVAVLSQYPGEGKSFFTAALALAYAKYLEARVLIVDTVQDPDDRSLFLEAVEGPQFSERRRPNYPTHPGCVYRFDTRNFSEEQGAWTDFQLGRYIDEIKVGYDLILLDTCAMTASGVGDMDPMILAKDMDAAVLVTSKASRDRDTLVGLKGELKRFEINLLGAIYNLGTNK